MENLAIRIHPKVINKIVETIFPVDTPENFVLELLIILDSEDLSVREFNNYFSFVDNIYGRLVPEGIYSYAHTSGIHLRIKGINKGSIEATLVDALINSVHPNKLVIVYFALKFLPNIIKASAEAVKSLAGAYKTFEEAETVRFERENRKNLRKLISEDEILHKLTPLQKEQLVKLLDSLYAVENKHLSPVIRIAKTKIKALKLQKKKK